VPIGFDRKPTLPLNYGGSGPLKNSPATSICRRILVFLCLAAGLALPLEPALAQDLRLAIAYSDSLKSTMRTITGIRRTVSRQYQAAVYYEYFLKPDQPDIEEKIAAIRKLNPRLILTVGSFATKEISERIKDKPIIFSAVLNPETSGFVESLDHPGGNISGASLDIPPEIQFTYFKRVIGSLKKIGVLYSRETANLIPPARRVAKSLGLELVAIEIESEKDIPRALDQLNSMVDGIWSVADREIYSPRSTRYILLNSLRNGQPFMGFSRNLVESGALFALDFDYKDIGRQAGKIAIEVISGRSPASIAVAVPGIIWFHYNEKTARHINVKLPEDLVAIAKEVYQ
jgi:putative ABC transport system substrate-binding protein